MNEAEAIHNDNIIEKERSRWYQTGALFLYFPVAIYLLYSLTNLSFRQPDTLISAGRFFLFFTINVALLIIWVLFLGGLTNSKWISFSITNVLIVVLGIANRIKLDVRGVGFVLQDIFVLGEGAEMTDALPKSFVIKVFIMSVLSLAILFTLTIFIKKPSFTGANRIKSILIGLLTFFFIYAISPTFLYIKQEERYLATNVSDVGGIYYFLIRLNTPKYTIGPSEKTVANVFSDFTPEPAPQASISPDIIIIQSEAFSDPTKFIPLKNFSEDPLPYFHQLEKESMQIDLAVPVFGGGTANTEFEVLTSLPVPFYPEGTIAYKEMSVPKISLASILRKQGYYSLAIHPFLPSYYNRDDAYYYMGFNQYIAIDDFIEKNPDPDINTYSYHTSDIALSRLIIQELEENSKKPNFIMAVTMQNHAPYNIDYPSLYAVNYKGSITPQESEENFNSYLGKLRYTDDSLNILVEYLKTRERPTLLVFYGDHQPYIDSNYNVMNQVGWSDYSSSHGSIESSEALHRTPCIIWSNYTDLSTDEVLVMDSINLGEKIMEITALNEPDYYGILRQLRYEGLESFSRNYAVVDGIVYTRNTPIHQYFEKKLSVLWGDISGPYKYLEDGGQQWMIPNNRNYIWPLKSESLIKESLSK